MWNMCDFDFSQTRNTFTTLLKCKSITLTAHLAATQHTDANAQATLH